MNRGSESPLAPSAPLARMLTVVSVFVGVVLPVVLHLPAIETTRGRRVWRAIQTATLVGGSPDSLVVAVWFAFFAVFMAAALVLWAFGVPPI